MQPTSSVLLNLFSACYCFLHVHLLTSHVHWLMDFPAGLKLNVNLTRVLGSVILTAIHLWNDLTSYLHSAILYADQIKWWGLSDKQVGDKAAAAHSRGVLTGIMLLRSLKDAAADWIRSFTATREPPQGQALQPPAAAPADSGSRDAVNNGRSNSKSSSSNAGSKSSSSSGGVWGVWGDFVARASWLWASCRLWLKAGLGTLLTTFRLGWLGLSASMFVAASADLLMIVTLHIFYVYVVCARLIHLNLKSLHSLFLLFRSERAAHTHHPSRLPACA